MISIIAAAMQDNEGRLVIGNRGQIPWRLKSEMEHFRETTIGSGGKTKNTLIIGRPTFESIGRPLPGRHTIVLSRQAQPSHEGILWARSFDEAIRVAEDLGSPEIFIAGGAQVYKEAIGDIRVERLVLTIIEGTTQGDAFFPPRALWKDRFRRELRRESYIDHHIQYTILTLRAG